MKLKIYSNLLVLVKLTAGVVLCGTFTHISSKQPSLEMYESSRSTYAQHKYIPRSVKARQTLYVEKKYKQKKSKDILIGSVFFSYGKIELGPAGLKSTSAVARELVRYFSEPKLDYRSVRVDDIYKEPEFIEQNTDYQIKIVGFSDNSGRTISNLRLGLKRAEEVARQLDKFGIPMNNTIVASYGESKSYYKTKKYRKVEVWLVQKVQSSNITLLYVFLFFAMFIIGGLIFYVMIAQKRQKYQQY